MGMGELKKVRERLLCNHARRISQSSLRLNHRRHRRISSRSTEQQNLRAHGLLLIQELLTPIFIGQNSYSMPKTAKFDA
jgi:hypothetical protein